MEHSGYAQSAIISFLSFIKLDCLVCCHECNTQGGQDVIEQQRLLDWNDQPIEPPQQESKQDNPCLALHGPGPEGVTCKDCIHFRYPLHRSGVRHWKCDLRKLTHGAATDHRVGWPACGKYEKREGEYCGG